MSGYDWTWSEGAMAKLVEDIKRHERDPRYRCFYGELEHPIDGSGSCMADCYGVVSRVLQEYYPLPYQYSTKHIVIPRGWNRMWFDDIINMIHQEQTPAPPRIPEVAYGAIPKIAFLVPTTGITASDLMIIKHVITKMNDEGRPADTKTNRKKKRK